MTETTRDTLGAMHMHGYQISVYCPNNHGAILDLEAMIARFGADFDVVARRAEFLRRLKCSQCHVPAETLLRSVANTPTPAGSHGGAT